jgi:Ran GTPase-activating protein (RanGAP) involved in mRNA processing and transport
MASETDQQLGNTSILHSLNPSATDEELLSVFHQDILEAVKTLKHAIDNDFKSQAIPGNVVKLPGRNARLVRPQVQVISQLLFPDYSPEKAIIHYEASRKKACQIVRANEEYEKATKEALKGVPELQRPWAGQELDPIPLTGPVALPMPVQIGEEEHFKDCFRFLASDMDPNDFLPGGSKHAQGQDKEHNLRVGNELTWGTPMVEFNRGVVYADRRLDLCKMVVGPTHITALMDSLRSNSFVKHFLLGNNIISATGCYAIASFIKEKPDQMETWYLAGNHIKPEGFEHLVDAMVASSSITNVWLKRNPLGPSAVSSLTRLITETRNLRTLDLENTELGDEGVARLFTNLKGKTIALKNVFVNANGVGVKGAQAIAELLEAGWPAESLMLGTNPTGDGGAFHLARAFRSNKSLVRVALQSNAFTSAGISAVCDALSGHPTIRAVDFSSSLTTKPHGLRYNYVDDEALPALKQLLRNPQLRLLELGRTAFSAEGVEVLRDAIASSTLCFFQANHGELKGSENSALSVDQQLKRNIQQFYGVSKKEFHNGLGLRLLRNTADVRLIDSVYRTRDKRNGFDNIKQYWDERRD